MKGYLLEETKPQGGHMPTPDTRSWPEYNARLKNRGSITVWIDEGVLEGWLAEEPETPCRGRSETSPVKVPNV